MVIFPRFLIFVFCSPSMLCVAAGVVERALSLQLNLFSGSAHEELLLLHVFYVSPVAQAFAFLQF